MYQLSYVIGETDIQPVYYHVHHADTLRFFEKARLAFMEEAGAPNDALIAAGIFPVISRIDVTYKRELFAGPVVVTCEECVVNGKAFIVKQRIINSKGKCAVEASVESMFMSGATKRAVAVPEAFVRVAALQGGASMD